MMLIAYCVTSIVFESQIVSPIAEITVKIATPSGNMAAMIVPKTIPRIISVKGPDINSAVIKSSWIRVSKVTSIAI